MVVGADFFAEKSLRKRVVRVAIQAGDDPIPHGGNHPAGIRTIEGTYRFSFFHSHGSIYV